MNKLIDRRLNDLYRIITFISAICISWSIVHGQEKKLSDPSPQSFDIYFHRISILDTTGQKIMKDWKIGVNGYNKYTNISDKDTADIIVTVDSLTTFYLFYLGKTYRFNLTDFALISGGDPKRTFSRDYEYNLYFQLPEQCHSISYSVFVKNEFWEGEMERGMDKFELKDFKGNPCGYEVCFLGNTNIPKKKMRKYRRLKSKI